MNLNHPKREPFVEVVLEDGRFARIRRPTRGDWLHAMAAAKGDALITVAILTTRITEIDGAPITLSEWLDADCELTQPIVEAISRMSMAANNNPNKSGVA